MSIDALVGQSPTAFLLASILIILAPGPDIALVARNTIARGRGAGLVTAGGAMAGVSVHVAAAVAGLSAVLMSSAYAFSIVKLVGAGYLLYLGARTLLASRRTGRDGDDGAKSEIFGEASSRLVLAPSSPALQGMLSAVLNPKLAVFFLTFLPQFVDAHHAPEASMLAHGVVFIAMASTWMLVWVLTLDGLSGVFRRSAVRAWMERATGAVLIGMGVRLALARR
jgi:threonine/homoserine/homoserine lactone efflux protein